MKKRGFTLVELLAVIAILAILVIVAMPNILKMFKESKVKSFTNEVETIKKEIQKEAFCSSINGKDVPPVISSVGDYQLDMDGRELDYYAELNRDGSIKYLEVSDGEHFNQKSENGGESGVIDLEEENPSSKLEYIKDNVATDYVFVYTNTYDIYDQNDSVPVIITNMSDFDLKFNVSYGNTKLNGDFTVPSKTEDYIGFVKLTMSMIDSMKVDKTYALEISTTTNIEKDASKEEIIVKHNYVNKIKVKRVNPGMLINGVTSSKGANIAYNQTGIFVPKNTDVGTLNVKVKNISRSTYKFKNIFRDELVMKTNNINEKVYKAAILSESELNKYSDYLNGGIYFYTRSDNSFSMDFTSQNNIQKIHFDFDVHINPGIVNDGELTIASKENASPIRFGDFYPMDKEDANEFHGTSHCSLYDCFGFERFNYDNDALKLDVREGIPILDIAQSMGINQSYSIYTTVLPDTLNQEGEPTGEFPATILAISQDYGLYLTWIGVYKNYLHVYSYHDGSSYRNNNKYTKKTAFISFDISKYEGKKLNLQITATKGGTTSKYINGDVQNPVTFTSGNKNIKYNVATIGDLRPTRGLRFKGKMYDIAIYNRVLSKDEVMHNWNYANNRWNIEK